MLTGPDFSEEHVLSNGARVTLRHIRPSDADELRRGFERLSSESRYRRFFSALGELTPERLRYLTEVDGVDHVAIVAVGTSPDLKNEVGYGVARFVRLADAPDVAEAALTVVDAMQHQGLGRILGLTLAEAARERGISHFRGETLATNAPVRQLLVDVGAEVRVESPNAIVFDVALGPPPREGIHRDSSFRKLLRATAVSASELLRGFAIAAPSPPSSDPRVAPKVAPADERPSATPPIAPAGSTTPKG